MYVSNTAEIRPDIETFFGKFPAAQEKYASVPLYHLTLGSNVLSIQEHGLRPTPELFPRDHGEFLLRVYNRYGSADPSHKDYIHDRILASGRTFLSTRQPDMTRPDYGVPERLMLLMRGMYALRNKTALSPQEKDYAATAFDEHNARLTDDRQTITALAVDPMAPGVLNSRFQNIDISRVSEPETAMHIAEYIDGPYPHNIAVDFPIEPAYISVHDAVPLYPDFVLQGVVTEASWTRCIV